jgi:hypothetical protein
VTRCRVRVAKRTRQRPPLTQREGIRDRDPDASLQLLHEVVAGHLAKHLAEGLLLFGLARPMLLFCNRLNFYRLFLARNNLQHAHDGIHVRCVLIINHQSDDLAACRDACVFACG